MIKPVFGFTFDHIIRYFPLKKHISHLTFVIKILCFILIIFVPLDKFSFYFIYMLLSIANVFINVYCEYLLVLSTKEAIKETNNNENHLTIYYGYSSLGTIIGSFFGGRLLEKYGLMWNFHICNIFCVVGIIFGILYREIRTIEVAQHRGVL